MLGAVGALLIYVAAFYAVLATIAETCTMGAADSLVAGPIVSIPLYLVGFALLVLRPLRPEFWLTMVLAVVAIAYQVYWTVRFAIAYSIYSIPVCDLITGYGPFNFDGREPEFIATWLVMSALAVAGVIWAGIRSYGRCRPSSDL